MSRQVTLAAFHLWKQAMDSITSSDLVVEILQFSRNT
jgi:hypothetical protein